MGHKVVLIPGDGIGPEVMEAARQAIEATGAAIEWDVREAGTRAVELFGTPLPAETLAAIKEAGVAFKGPLTTLVGTGFRSINVAIRQQLDLYACLRPCRAYPGARTKYPGIDLVVVRENTEDLYAGIEFNWDSEAAASMTYVLKTLSGQPIREDAALSIKYVSKLGTERIARFAFDYARKKGRRKVTAVHKANIMKASDGLFLSIAREVAEDYPEIDFEDRIVDNMCMQLVQRPEFYDVILAPNLYGDILSDLCAGLVGGLGVAPGASIGAEIAVFEAVHGSAPRYSGLNKANPMAVMLTGALMLEHLGETDAATRLEAAVAEVIAEGVHVTYDMKPDRNDPTAEGTREAGAAVVERLRRRR